MTIQEINLIRNSWLLVKPIQSAAGLIFYDKLFMAAPTIRHFFKDDIHDQAGKLMAILGFVVSKLDNLDSILMDVQKLGERHNKYGAKKEHYDVVGNCLIETLAEALGPQWDSDTEKAWIKAFMLIKEVMVCAQESALKPSLATN